MITDSTSTHRVGNDAVKFSECYSCGAERTHKCRDHKGRVLHDPHEARVLLIKTVDGYSADRYKKEK